MSQLNLQANMTDADAFYHALANLYRDSDEERVGIISNRLIVLLANHIGDQAILQQALEIAGQAPETTVEKS